MSTITTQLADALRRYLDCAPTRDAPGDTPAKQAREALAYDARKPEPPSLADALRAILNSKTQAEAYAAQTAAREVLFAYDAQQAQEQGEIGDCPACKALHGVCGYHYRKFFANNPC